MSEKKTPLYQEHLDLKAKMVEFGGWLMPVQYSGIIAEHHAVRQAAGLFDASHMGEFFVRGADAEAFLQKLLTNDISIMRSGQVQYSPMCYENGATVDDLLVYKFDAEYYVLVVNAGNAQKDWQWLQANTGGFDVELKDASEKTALIAIQGPRAREILAKLAASDLSALLYYRFLPGALAGGFTTLISRTGYTGEDGFEIYINADEAPVLWRKLLAAGQEYGLLPAGLGARDTLRFEACLPLYGHELSEEITPVEAGLGMFVKQDKGEFNGRAVLAAQKKEGPARKIVGLEMVGRGIARAGCSVLADGKNIGTITTGSPAPTLNKNLGLALLAKEFTAPGQEVDVDIRGKLIKAKITAKPFYSRRT